MRHRILIASVFVAAFGMSSTPALAQAVMRKVRLVAPDSTASLSWTSVATDPQGDGLQKRLPDAKDLSYAIDSPNDRVWFRIVAYTPLPERWFGMSVAIDDDGNPDNGMAWWGTNKIKFDRLVSAFLFEGDGYWQGYAGVSDSAAVARGNMNSISSDVTVSVDRARNAVLLGVPRAALGPAAAIRVVGTIGSMLANNDDVP